MVICDDKDPPWLNTRIKNLISYKKYFINIFSWRQKHKIEEFKLLQNKVVNLTNDLRDRYYTRTSNKLPPCIP